VKIFCLCLVRDEADIIGHTLAAALEWATAVFVCDNGSTDGTWEMLQEYARRNSKVVLAGRHHGLYQHSLWGELANRYRFEAEEGDWWCRLDADEVYIDDPREFLATVADYDQVVFSASVHYYFTDVDLAEYECDPARYARDWYPGRLRHYITNWSEERFVRHVPGAEWVVGWPAGFWQMWSAPRRIRLRHYQYRTPPQIQRRLEARLTHNKGYFVHERKDVWLPRGLGEKDLVSPPRPPHARDELWKTRLVRAGALHFDDGSDPLIDDALLPPMWGRRSRLKRAARRIRPWL
jgi:glycosyltransferase involved in cell wall biosynthesis